MNKTELKYAVQATGSHYFERSSMQFFGDTMANYYTPNYTTEIITSSGRVVTCWQLQRVRPVKHGLCSTTYFDVNDFERVLPYEGQFTAAMLKDLKTINQGQFDNLKIESNDERICISRMTVADGMEYDNQITHETLSDGVWTITRQYEG